MAKGNPLINIDELEEFNPMNSIRNFIGGRTWAANENELEAAFNDPNNPYYRNPGFGEAKAANVQNIALAGKTPFRNIFGEENPYYLNAPGNVVDNAIGGLQTLGFGTLNGLYQLKNDGFTSKAFRDWGEENAGYAQARFMDVPYETAEDLQKTGNLINTNLFDASNINVEDYSTTQQRVQAERAAAAKQQQILADQTRMQQGQITQGGLGPNGGRAKAPQAPLAPQVTARGSGPNHGRVPPAAPVLPAPVKSTPVKTVSPGGGNSRRTYSKPAATAPSVSRPRARATRGRSAPIVRQSRNGPPQNRFR